MLCTGGVGVSVVVVQALRELFVAYALPLSRVGFVLLGSKYLLI